MGNNCYEKYLTSRLAKEKYADLIFKIVEKIYGIIFTSLLSVSAIYLIFPATGVSIPLWIIVVLTIVGLVAAIFLTIFALKYFQSLGEASCDANELACVGVNERYGAGNEINVSSSDEMSVQINCGTTKISIHIKPTQKEIK